MNTADNTSLNPPFSSRENSSRQWYSGQPERKVKYKRRLIKNDRFGRFESRSTIPLGFTKEKPSVIPDARI